MNDFTEEIQRRQRFSFGLNWKGFLTQIDSVAINESLRSLLSFLRCKDLEGYTFLDIGSGSGLSSLVARKSGAQVVSFDYNEDSVNCTNKLKHQYFDGDDSWSITQGLILDEEFVSWLGRFEIVYSWGVLHHTGDMCKGMSNAARLLKREESCLFPFIMTKDFRPIYGA